MKNLRSELRASILKKMRALLKSHGYKANGSRYRRDEDDLVKFIWLSSLPQTGPDFYCFTVDVSIASEVVVAHAPRIFFCGIDYVMAPYNNRIGWLSKHKQDYWWYVYSEKDCQDALQEIEDILVGRVFPMLDAIQTSGDLARVLREGQPGLSWPKAVQQWLADILEGKEAPPVPPGSTL